MPKPLIAANWKMNTTVEEARALVSQMRGGLERVKGVEKVLCPPFVSLVTVKGLLDGSSIMLGAQNLFYEEKGAYTGEVSPLMLRSLCRFVIVGHSERRQHFHESDEVVNRKLAAALKVGLRPIMCVGENLAQREAGQEAKVVEGQLRQGLKGLPAPQGLVVAYEPIWAIGTGRPATAEAAQAMARQIRATLAELYGSSYAQSVPVLYGGSVTPDSVEEFVRVPEIDGALVGGASLKAQDFTAIVEKTAKAKGASPSNASSPS